MESTEVYTQKYRCFCFITGHFAHIFRHFFNLLPQKPMNPTGFHTHQFAPKSHLRVAEYRNFGQIPL